MMLSKAQEKLIKSLHNNKGRQKSGLCLVEGQKVIDLAGDLIETKFTKDDSMNFDQLVTTETPQEIAATARIPKWNVEDISSKEVIVFLDNVQDPGNVGSILRLCLGFDASLVLVESVDVTSPKVIRSSVGAMFQVPWLDIDRTAVDTFIKEMDREVYRLEKKDKAEKFNTNIKKPLVLIAGSEGQGIKLNTKGKSIYIDHSEELESLNVGHALAIALYNLR
ncbi:MAG: RNA methyltransferase [Candidatus Komeilibacteria bacterium]